MLNDQIDSRRSIVKYVLAMSFWGKNNQRFFTFLIIAISTFWSSEELPSARLKEAVRVKDDGEAKIARNRTKERTPSGCEKRFFAVRASLCEGS
jgi:hypothetical protein